MLQANNEIGGGKAITRLPKGQPESAEPFPKPMLPREAKKTVPQGQMQPVSLGSICGELMTWQHERCFAIVTQSRCDRAVEAYIRVRLGYRTDMPEADRKRLAKLSRDIKSAVESGKPVPEEAGAVAARCALVVLRNQKSRAVWDEFRVEAEKAMIKLAKQLPAWLFVESVKGVSALGLAVIVGEAGNLGDYPKKGHLWKRLGMAVLDGKRQGNPGAGATADDWIAHGYNKKRRAQIWAMLDDVMLRQQWQGGEAKGPYGAYYARKKAEYLAREWTAGHADKAARRYMTKMFLRDLLAAWKRTGGNADAIAK